MSGLSREGRIRLEVDGTISDLGGRMEPCFNLHAGGYGDGCDMSASDLQWLIKEAGPAMLAEVKRKDGEV